MPTTTISAPAGMLNIGDAVRWINQLLAAMERPELEIPSSVQDANALSNRMAAVIAAVGGDNGDGMFEPGKGEGKSDNSYSIPDLPPELIAPQQLQLSQAAKAKIRQLQNRIEANNRSIARQKKHARRMSATEARAIGLRATLCY